MARLAAGFGKGLIAGQHKAALALPHMESMKLRNGRLAYGVEHPIGTCRKFRRKQAGVVEDPNPIGPDLIAGYKGHAVQLAPAAGREVLQGIVKVVPVSETADLDTGMLEGRQLGITRL